MPAYRLFILDGSSHIHASEIIEAGTDTEAIRAAGAILEARTGELWLASKIVCTFGVGTRKGPAV